MFEISLVLCFLLHHIWRVRRRNAYLKELLRREKELHFKRYNEIATSLTREFSKGPAPTLEDLASDIDSEFTLTRSKKP